MNLRTRLSRSNGYRELGMFDESILELEAIEFGEDRWHPLVIEARYKTYRDAKEWELARVNGMGNSELYNFFVLNYRSGKMFPVLAEPPSP